MKTVTYWIFFFCFFTPFVSFAVIPLKLRVRAWYFNDAEAQFLIGIEKELYQRNIPRAKQMYLEAIRQEQPDAANRMAVLLENEGQVSEAIQLHEKAVEWSVKNDSKAFVSLTDIHYKYYNTHKDPIEINTSEFKKKHNPSRWIDRDDLRFEIPSPGAASALALARIYQEGFISDKHHKVPLDTGKSDSWYEQAFQLGVPAVVIGVLLVNDFDEPEKAIEWFIKASEDLEYVPFAYYKMGNCYKALEEYNQAIISYKKATEFKFRKGSRGHNGKERLNFAEQAALEFEFRKSTYYWEDYKFATLAALELGRIHKQDLSEGEIPADPELSKYFYKRAYQIGKAAQQDIMQVISEETEELNTYLGNSFFLVGPKPISTEEIERNNNQAIQQMGAARRIAEDYRKDYIIYGKADDVKLALHWYETAYLDTEISFQEHEMAISGLRPQKKPVDSCQNEWGN